MSKKHEKLRDKFEEETNLKCWSEPHFEDVGFSDKYVIWLEKQLLLYNVVNNDSDVCPEGKDCKTIMFTSDLDICQKCNKTFEGK